MHKDLFYLEVGEHVAIKVLASSPGSSLNAHERERRGGPGDEWEWSGARLAKYYNIRTVIHCVSEFPLLKNKQYLIIP